MAKSKLKTLISEHLGIKRKNIEFEYPNNEDSGIRIYDNNKDENIFALNFALDEFCCGILALGDTTFSLNIEGLSEDNKDELCVELLNQTHKMIKSKVGDGINKGIITWSHTNDNTFAKALKSEYNTEDMPWKLVSEFYNPNSTNTVCYFIAKISEDRS